MPCFSNRRSVWSRNLASKALIFPGAMRAIKASSHGQQPAAGFQLMAGPGPAFSTQAVSARQAATTQHDMAALGGPVTVHARGTGNPRISFDDGRQPASFSELRGDLGRHLGNRSAKHDYIVGGTRTVAQGKGAFDDIDRRMVSTQATGMPSSSRS